MRLQLGLSAGACACALVLLGLAAAHGCGGSLSRLDHTPGLFVDFGIYYVQAKHVVAGELALHPNWVYPPLAAALVAGFGLLELQPARVLWGLVQALACAGMVYLCAAELRSWRRPARWLTAGALVFTSLPVWHCLKWGQVSLLVVICSVLALQGRRAWLLGLAAGIKLYPACYAIVYVARLELRPVLRAALATLGLGVVLPLIALGPLLNGMLWGRVVGTLTQIDELPLRVYQTLPALIVKWIGAGSVQSVLTAALCSAALIGTCLRSHQRRAQPLDTIDIASVVLCASLLLPPAWVHYYAVLPLAHAVLLRRATVRCPSLWLLLASYALNSVPLCLSVIDPAFFARSSELGLITLSGALGLVGLWSCPLTAPASLRPAAAVQPLSAPS